LENAFESRAEPLTGRDILRHDDELTEEIIGKFDIEREIKSDRAAPDIGAPLLDVGILAEDLIELGRAIAAGVDRCILRQPQIDKELRPVLGREELSRHMRKGEKRENEAGERHQNGDPPHPHGGNQYCAKDADGHTGFPSPRRLRWR
jgi:hypothetical protein